jgi:hypothetical protein
MESRREQSGADWNHSRNDALDRELDAALTQYAAVEPRAGFDERILANLRAERERVPASSWWRWSAALAAVAVVVLALAWRWNRQSPPVVRNHPSVSQPAQPATQTVSNGVDTSVRPVVLEAPRIAASPRKDAPRHAAHVTWASQPKLDQFPSPEPLSEQEKILRDYVTAFPEHAVLIARARTEAMRRDQIEDMKSFPSGEWTTDSVERNDARSNDTTER